eukprot:4069768-Prymnesium_polylepis.1
MQVWGKCMQVYVRGTRHQNLARTVGRAKAHERQQSTPPQDKEAQHGVGKFRHSSPDPRACYHLPRNVCDPRSCVQELERRVPLERTAPHEGGQEPSLSHQAR